MDQYCRLACRSRGKNLSGLMPSSWQNRCWAGNAVYSGFGSGWICRAGFCRWTFCFFRATRIRCRFWNRFSSFPIHSFLRSANGKSVWRYRKPTLVRPRSGFVPGMRSCADRSRIPVRCGFRWRQSFAGCYRRAARSCRWVCDSSDPGVAKNWIGLNFSK